MFQRTPDELKASLRANEIRGIMEAWEIAGEGALIALVGPSGVGKSTVVRLLQSGSTNQVVTTIDLAASRNRTPLGVAAAIARTAASNERDAFFALASDARSTGKDRYAREALQQFGQIYPKMFPAKSLIVLDNIDRASTRVRSWMAGHILGKSDAQTLVTARSLPEGVVPNATIPLQPFGRDRLALLAQYWCQALGRDIDELSDFLVLHSEGHPVQAELCAWAMSCCEQKTNLAEITAKDLIGKAVGSLPNEAYQEIKCAIYAYQRINDRIHSSLTGHSELKLIPDLPFAYAIPDDLGGYQIHPVAFERIRGAAKVEPTDIFSKREVLIAQTYPLLIAEGYSKELTSTLEFERLRYLASLGTAQKFAAIETAFRARRLKGEFWRAEEVAQIAEEVFEESETGIRPRAALLAIENCIIRHDIAEALHRLSALPRREISSSPKQLQLQIRCLEARCVTSPSAVSGNEIFSVVGKLEKLRAEAVPLGALSGLTDDILYELAQAYRLVARYNDAAVTLQELESRASDQETQLRSIEEQSMLLRLAQNLEEAERLLAKAAVLRLQNDISIGAHGLYCAASLRRDQNRFEEATKLYERARAAAVDECDDLLTCCIVGDWAWMQFLADEVVSFRSMLDEYESIAGIYRFSREMAECLHMHYHFHAANDDWPQAYQNLDDALSLAEQFGNVVMRLDCMMHQVQRAIREDRTEDAEKWISSMKQVEEKGCGIRVFRGRAQIYFGDGLLDAGRSRDALTSYLDGFDAVARFGVSRSNVELLSELADGRKESIQRLVDEHPDVRDVWQDDDTADSLVQLLGLRG